MHISVKALYILLFARTINMELSMPVENAFFLACMNVLLATAPWESLLFY